MTPTLIITRPEPAGGSFASRVIASLGRDIPVIYSPAFRIAWLDAVLPQTDNVIFTSQNGVVAAQRLDLPQTATAWCVGDRTAKAATDAGFDAISAGGDAAALLSLIQSRKPKGDLLHLGGVHSRGNIAGELTQRGYSCAFLAGYEQIALPASGDLINAMAGNDPLVSPVFSPRSAAPLAVVDRAAQLHGVAISGAVADILTGLQFDTVTTSVRPDEPAMLDAVCNVVLRLLDRG